MRCVCDGVERGGGEREEMAERVFFVESRLHLERVVLFVHAEREYRVESEVRWNMGGQRSGGEHMERSFCNEKLYITEKNRHQESTHPDPSC